MAEIREAGYSLSAMNTPELRCFQGMERDGATVVFMHVYCAIEDQMDMMHFSLNRSYSPGVNQKMLNLLEQIGLPQTQEVMDFIQENGRQFNQGEQVGTTIGTWKVSASGQLEGGDVIISIALFSPRFVEEAQDQQPIDG
jgi:hypothetical protein